MDSREKKRNPRALTPAQAKDLEDEARVKIIKEKQNQVTPAELRDAAWEIFRKENPVPAGIRFGTKKTCTSSALGVRRQKKQVFKPIVTVKVTAPNGESKVRLIEESGKAYNAKSLPDAGSSMTADKTEPETENTHSGNNNH